MEAQTFEAWFKELVVYAKEHGAEDLIDKANPDAYLEYFDDGDSVEDCFDTEFEARSEEG